MGRRGDGWDAAAAAACGGREEQRRGCGKDEVEDAYVGGGAVGGRTAEAGATEAFLLGGAAGGADEGLQAEAGFLRFGMVNQWWSS